MVSLLIGWTSLKKSVTSEAGCKGWQVHRKASGPEQALVPRPEGILSARG